MFPYLQNSIARAKNGSRFKRNFYYVVRGNIAAQALAVLLAPILSRLYTPEDFASLATFQAVLSLLVSIACWRVDWMLPNARTQQQSWHLLFLGILVLGFFVAMVIVATFSIPSILHRWELDIFFSGELFLFLMIALIGTVTYQMLVSWYVREGKLKIPSNVRILQSIANCLMSISGGIAQLGAIGLVGSNALSTLFGASQMWRDIKNNLPAIHRITRRRLATTARRFIKPATLSVAVSLLNTASLAVIPILLIQYYSAKEVGWYALMQRLAITPVSFITEGIAKSFWSEAAQLINSDKFRLKKLYLRTSIHLLVIAVPVGIMCLLGPYFVGPIFGRSEWNGAGLILAALTPMIIGFIAVQPLTHLVIHHKQKWKLYLDASRLAITIALIVVLANDNVEFFDLILYLSLLSLFSHMTLFYLNLKCFQK